MIDIMNRGCKME